MMSKHHLDIPPPPSHGRNEYPPSLREAFVSVRARWVAVGCPSVSPPSPGPAERPGAGPGPAAADRQGRPAPVPRGEHQQAAPQAPADGRAARGAEAEGPGERPQPATAPGRPPASAHRRWNWCCRG